jgi:glycosyltransferase involved in cell wall biosynthesis
MTARRYKVMQLGSPTGLYGAERWILALVRHLDPAQVESIVGVILDDPKLEAPLIGAARNLGFGTAVVEAHGKVNWASVSKLRKYIVDHGVDCLHTHGYKTDVIGLLATRGTGCKVITTPHGWNTQGGFALRMYEVLDRALFALFDAVVPLSEAICEELRRYPFIRGKVQLIQNAVDIGEIDGVSEIAAPIRAWKEQGNFVVGYIGQLIPRKCIPLILQAFARLPMAKKKLALLGEGEQRAELEALATTLGIRSDVEFFGFRPDRISFLKGFDVFALASRLEGIPRCLMEAMAAQVCIVASDIPGCADLIRDGETGLLFKLDDGDALLGQLQKCVDDGERDRLARNGRGYVLANYSATAMAARYQELYRQLLGV